ncbi:pentatricopeptide repeat-containing protein At3g26630, chloroplastic-like [Aristolochia californica]|uniref:pentatricopeptide repeat-containing protein At3g26630, chloroplastic-like n=1 Tax=Aristolochia californica TaxID=171875 RepID=UPI0035DAF28E
MVECLACAIDARLPRRLLCASRTRLDSREALIHLQTCRNFRQLKLMHAQILKNDLIHDHILVTKLIRLCSSYRKVDYAIKLFNQLENPLTFTWNIMIRAYTLNDSPGDALLLYTLMISCAVPPDKFTFPFVIKACSYAPSVKPGKVIHAHVIKSGFPSDTYVQNTLMDVYLKFGVLDDARIVFDKMRVKNVVSWTTMVSGMVACGELEASRGVFEHMPVRNVVAWTAMINGYSRIGQVREAFEFFHQMQRENVRPNEFTLVSLLIACTKLGSSKLGSWVHEYAKKEGFKMGVFLGTALIDMYSKCGSIDNALKVFNVMPKRNLATWNAMITSLGVHGHGKEALLLFSDMEKASKIKPDEITFVAVLSACVQACLVEEGCSYFVSMKHRYGIQPTLEHYRCMVELLGRASMILEAHELAKNILNSDIGMSGGLLNAIASRSNAYSYADMSERTGSGASTGRLGRLNRISACETVIAFVQANVNKL